MRVLAQCRNEDWPNSLFPHDEDVASRKLNALSMATQSLSSKNRTLKRRDLARSARPYKLVALGGTFDVLHAGHRHLLYEAFRLGDVVLIGVTSDRFVATLDKKHQVRSFATRVRDLNRLLKNQHWYSRARISALREPYGPAARRKKLQALIVSRGTLASGRRLNRLRAQNGLPPVDLRTVNLVKAADGNPISATRIRNGEIDSEGTVLRRRP
jgi:pantetheine-phosphate adenylyltransferase